MAITFLATVAMTTVMMRSLWRETEIDTMQLSVRLAPTCARQLEVRCDE